MLEAVWQTECDAILENFIPTYDFMSVFAHFTKVAWKFNQSGLHY